MKYILSGTASEVAKVIRENRIREARGLIKFTPVPEGGKKEPEAREAEKTDTKEVKVDDTKEVENPDTKEVSKPKGKK